MNLAEICNHVLLLRIIVVPPVLHQDRTCLLHVIKLVMFREELHYKVFPSLTLFQLLKGIRIVPILLDQEVTCDFIVDIAGLSQL